MILPSETPLIGEEQDAQKDKAILLIRRQVEITLELIFNKKWAEKLMADELFYALSKEEKEKIKSIAAEDPEGQLITIMKNLEPILGEEGKKSILDIIGPDNTFLPLIKQAWG